MTLRGWSLFLLCLPLATWAGRPMAVVKSAKGELRAAGGGQDSAARDLKPADLLASGVRIQSGPEGKAVLRLLPEMSFLEVRGKTAFGMKRARNAGKTLRRVRMDSGEVIFGLKKKGEAVQCENAQTLITATAPVSPGKGKPPGPTVRFSCAAWDKGDAIGIVQSGEISVYNRPKDLTAVVRAGQKAISDGTGIRISDATDAELDQVGFRQNTLEVDFLNPQTEEFTTLEVDYETQF